MEGIRPPALADKDAVAGAGAPSSPDAAPRAYVWQAANTTYVPLYSVLDTERIRRRKNPDLLPLPGTEECGVLCQQQPRSQMMRGIHYQRSVIAENEHFRVFMNYGFGGGWSADRNVLKWYVVDKLSSNANSRPSGEIHLGILTFRQAYEQVLREYRRLVRAAAELVGERAEGQVAD